MRCVTGRRYRGERAYNFWEVYLPNLVEQVNAVNSTMIRKKYFKKNLLNLND